ncbi:hypothetical protein RCK98_24175, partial [Salmonella enterica subsp. enterica serovar 1,4,[5],12:i:-]
IQPLVPLPRRPLKNEVSSPVAEFSRVRSPSSLTPQPQTAFANTQQVPAKTGFFGIPGRLCGGKILEEYRRFMQTE